MSKRDQKCVNLCKTVGGWVGERGGVQIPLLDENLPSKFWFDMPKGALLCYQHWTSLITNDTFIVGSHCFTKSNFHNAIYLKVLKRTPNKLFRITFLQKYFWGQNLATRAVCWISSAPMLRGLGAGMQIQTERMILQRLLKALGGDSGKKTVFFGNPLVENFLWFILHFRP